LEEPFDPAQDKHELAALGTQDMVLPGGSLGCGGLFGWFSWWRCEWQQALLQSSQAGAQGCGEEAEVAHFDEAAWQDVLEEALDEVFHGESADFKLPGV
jgi:hypothetical protein